MSLLTVTLISTPVVLAGNPEVVTSRGQQKKKRETTEDCGGHGILKKGGKNLEAVTRTCDTNWREIVARKQIAIFAMTYLPFLKDFMIV